MKQKRLLSLILTIVMLISLLPCNGAAAEIDDRTQRTVYVHARGENPADKADNSIVYMGETANVYFAVDNPNKGAYDEQTNTHTEPQYDMNGYTIRLCYDPDYFELAEGSANAPIQYSIPDSNFPDSGSVDENIGEDTGENLPATVGYFVYKHGSGDYTLGEKTYKTAYITVFYSGGFVPQKKDGQLWYNLAKLPLTPKKTGSTDVFVDIDSGEEDYTLELFAKNLSDELSEQTFTYNALYGGYHHILIKDKSRPTPPVATPGSGSYVEKISVTLTQAENCRIFYTTDGSDPAESSSRIEYNGPFDIDVSTSIRTCAYRDSDGKYSNTVTYTYEILPDRPYLFDTDKVLLPDIYSSASKFSVYVADKNVFGNITDGSEVYYTFVANADADNPVYGTDPEVSWVKVDKQHPVIEIDQKRTVKLITEKMGQLSEPAWYYFSIMPAPVVASHDSGEYSYKIDVTLSTETEGAVIWYTTDGSDPKTSDTRREYADIPITIAKDTTLRAIASYDGEWSDKSSYYYLFSYYDDYGVNAFYPSGVYEGSVNVTLTPNNPDYTIKYHTGDGIWKDYTDVLTIDSNTDITAKAVDIDDEGNIKSEGGEYTFTYKIKPLPPAFAPESTQFTNAKSITIYTPESTEDNTEHFQLYYTLDGSDPVTSPTRIAADSTSDSAVIEIAKYTVVSAVVLKDGETYSTVVTHSYDIVKLKPVKPLTTLLPGDYVLEIGGEPYSTQF
ncbi:MAG: chitobiase/beta-hexosaminidase C-terminal domain-containing protein, partial [Clostridia bacterium]|nr:chitobiase/beta-hexosaminidase C-terminal domain-containing protein [Clostridia bacterium]